MDSVFRSGKPVIRELQVAFDFDKTHSPQIREMPRDSWLREPQNFDDIADTQLTGGKETQYSNSRWICKAFEDFIEIIDGCDADCERRLADPRAARFQCHICHNAYNVSRRI